MMEGQMSHLCADTHSCPTSRRYLQIRLWESIQSVITVTVWVMSEMWLLTMFHAYCRDALENNILNICTDTSKCGMVPHNSCSVFRVHCCPCHIHFCSYSCL